MYSTKKLSEISNFYNKGVLPKEGQFYNYVGLENIESNTGRLVDFTETEGKKIKSNKVEFKKGMVLYGKLRPYLNKVLIADFDGVATTEILPIECSKDLLNTYLSYYLRTPSFVALANGNISGARMPRVSPKFLKEEVFIPLPPLSTQSRIVARLDSAFASIDEQISLLRANIADVENMRKSVLEESFQSGEYEVKKLEEIVSFLSGGTPSKSNKDFWIGDIPWISPKDMKQDKLDSGTDYISQSAVDSSATKLLPINSLLCVTRSGILVRSFPVAINIVPVAFNQDIRAMIPGKNIDSEYLFYALRARENEVLSNGIKKGPTVHSIISGYLDKLQIPLPPLPRQHEIVTHLDRVFETTRALRAEYEEQIGDLSTLKQSLLEEAFAGRLVTEEMDLQL